MHMALAWALLAAPNCADPQSNLEMKLCAQRDFEAADKDLLRRLDGKPGLCGLQGGHDEGARQGIEDALERWRGALATAVNQFPSTAGQFLSAFTIKPGISFSHFACTSRS